MADGEEFARLTTPFRRELLAHCYRMLGSFDDAEDLVQETYLRAWRAYGRFEGRSSLRLWLHRIATNTCLNALETRDRRPLPSGLGGPSDTPESPPAAADAEVPWLQPFPDRVLGTVPDDPAAVIASRGSLRLALVAAMQHLPARQRAVLLLRDVLACSASEVAEMLGTTTAAVNSALQRARAHLEQVAPDEDELAEPADGERRVLLDRYVAAFEKADVAELLQLLRADVVLEMPPLLSWFAGRDAVRRFFGAHVLTRPDALRMVHTRANGQPAVAAYVRGPDDAYQMHAIHVLTLRPGGIARIVVFLDDHLFARFGLAPALHAAPLAALGSRT
ncbi:sigma-70 family RNA polymerase sigma factor [Phytohabitans flavus]|uniref:RNA polymerase sigma factor n=1 Tax=Phytohabitans flavus TaxID=1076124 RepID=A0A6F8XM33_9ACTN|nr:sigma-70 family RNA polymerase sigma factor [Phytohabitans flavus]BCB74867.1 RNA polymerase sigma factor [Phytohabitans flavus]